MFRLLNKDIIINTKQGKVKGTKIDFNDKEFFLFKGIPYAHPPIYSLRWKPPILFRANYSEDVYDAGLYKDKPYEIRGIKRIFNNYMLNKFHKINFSFVNNYFMKNKESEDCLYLNILTPTCERDKLPVLIYLTDTFFNFNTNDDIYLNKKIANKNILVVTINYRLGIFGFFYHTELDKESKNKVSGNYGIMDIICAIKWIKSNIISYGGNPDNITLMGDGAGANIIVYLMCNSGNEGLFQKVIINSYSFIHNIRRKSKINIDIVDKLVGQGKNQILRLRNIETKILNELYKKMILDNGKIIYENLFGPIIDGNIIIDEPYLIFSKGKQMNIPVIMGKNVCDGDMFYDIGLNSVLRNPNHDLFFKDKMSKLMNKYLHIEKNSIIALRKYYDDFLFTIPIYLFMNFHKERNKVFVYIFNYERCINDSLIEGVYNCFSYYFNNISNYFNIDEPTHNILLDHITEFIWADMGVFSSFSIKDNTIWKSFEKDFIILLGRTSCSKKIKINDFELLENRYIQNLEKYKDNKEKIIILDLIDDIFNTIIRKI